MDYGIISLRINGATYQTRGAFEVKATAHRFTAQGNHDGSGFRTAEPSPPMINLTFERAGIRWDDSMMRAEVDVTVLEDLSGVQHIVTGGYFVGEPTQNLTTGEVSGLSVSWGNPRDYQRAGA